MLTKGLFMVHTRDSEGAYILKATKANFSLSFHLAVRRDSGVSTSEVWESQSLWRCTHRLLIG